MAIRRNLVENPRAANDLSTYSQTTSVPAVRIDFPGISELMGIDRTLDTLVQLYTAANGEGLWVPFTPVDGQVYTASAHAIIVDDTTNPANMNNGLRLRVYRQAAPSAMLAQAEPILKMPDAGTMYRLSVTFTASGSVNHTIRLIQIGNGTMEYVVTGFMVEPGPNLKPYGAGDTPGWLWDGAAHASESRTHPRPLARNAVAELDLQSGSMELSMPTTDLEIVV